MPGDLLIRAPNHLGDLVMALPALEAAGGDVLVARWLVPVLELSPAFAPGAEPARRILPLDRGARGLAEAVRAVRSGGYRRGILLTPSFSSALIFAVAGVRERRGTPTDGRGFLLTEVVPPSELAGLHRSERYLRIVTGERPSTRPVPRLVVPEAAAGRWRALMGPRGEGRLVGIFPGSNAPSRRWEPDRFAAVARAMAGQGARVVVFGGGGERELAAQVAGDVALNVAGRTDLPTLAAGLADCDLLITNDSGPMHLAAAVGTPTISLWGAGDRAETGPLGSGHRVLVRADLPCVPCVRNHCPRRGRGYLLEDAERECLRLIEAKDVLAAVDAGGGDRRGIAIVEG